MKNAYVTEHHFGDSGTVDVGMVLTEMGQKRFDELEKKGLVREATAAEVKAGYQPPFAAEEDAEDDDSRIASLGSTARLIAQQAEGVIERLRDEHAKVLEALKSDHDDALKAGIGRAEAAEQALGKAVEEVKAMNTALESKNKELTEVRTEVEKLKTKAASAPANKKAADPANKGV